MTNVIIYTNDNGNVSVCIPTGDLSIEEVLAKDCPEGAIIVDASSLPRDDDDFFDAWRLYNGEVSVNLEAARAIHLSRFNAEAREKAASRAMNTACGIGNAISDEDFITDLNVKRAEIAAAFSIAELRVIKA